MAKCKYCNDEIQWKQPYETGDKPINMDGSNHNCEKQTTLATSSKYTSNKIPMEKATEIYMMAVSLMVLFEEKYGEVSIEQKLQGIESFYKTLSGSYKI